MFGRPLHNVISEVDGVEDCFVSGIQCMSEAERGIDEGALCQRPARRLPRLLSLGLARGSFAAILGYWQEDFGIFESPRKSC